jgi:hypothetical protein
VCSATRYTNTDGRNQERILQGGLVQSGGCDWLHGHWRGKAGVALYGSAGWRTEQTEKELVHPNTDWVVMCGTNAVADGKNLILANGVDVGIASAVTNSGSSALWINGGCQGSEVVLAAPLRATMSNTIWRGWNASNCIDGRSTPYGENTAGALN